MSTMRNPIGCTLACGLLLTATAGCRELGQILAGEGLDVRPGCDERAPDMRCEGDPRPLPDLAIPCRGSADCTMAGAPICDSTTRSCRACRVGADCATRDPARSVCLDGAACVECGRSTDCPAERPVCGVDHGCKACEEDGDCTNQGICYRQQCIDPSKVAWVDNALTCLNMIDKGTRDSPYCLVGDALAKSTAPYITVAGRSAAYKEGTLAVSRDVVIRGPGKDAAMRATLSFEGAVNGVEIGANRTVVLDGLEITGAQQLGISCTHGASSLRVRDSVVRGNSRRGIDGGPSCDIVVDACIVSKNNQGGIYAEGPCEILNTVVANNGNDQPGSTLGGVWLVGAVPRRSFRFNTVVGNKAGAVHAAGVKCDASEVIEASIVTGNTRSGGSQFANCSLANVVVGANEEPPGMGAVEVVKFRDPGMGDYRLADDTTCCVDRIPAAGAGYPDHDFLLSPRPKGNAKAYDIGAHELR